MIIFFWTISILSIYSWQKSVQIVVIYYETFPYILKVTLNIWFTWTENKNSESKTSSRSSVWWAVSSCFSIKISRIEYSKKRIHKRKFWNSCIKILMISLHCYSVYSFIFIHDVVFSCQISKNDIYRSSGLFKITPSTLRI